MAGQTVAQSARQPSPAPPKAAAEEDEEALESPPDPLAEERRLRRERIERKRTAGAVRGTVIVPGWQFEIALE